MQIPVRIVLVETTHPGNIGATARAMKTMGLADLALVNPLVFPSCEATARASGAEDLLERATVHGTLTDAIADCGFVVGTSARPRSIEWPAVNPRECAASVLDALGLQNRAAIVFGPEHSGLTNEALARCALHVRIPTQPGFSSLNLGMAVQVLCYELRVAALERIEDRPGAAGRAFLGPAEEGFGDRSDEPIVSAPESTPESPSVEPPEQQAERSAEEPPDDPRPVGGRHVRPRLATAAELESFHEHLERVLTESGFLREDHPRALKLKLRRIFQRAALDRNEIDILRGALTALDPSKRRADRSAP